MVELRKRPARAAPPETRPAKKPAPEKKSTKAKAEAPAPKPETKVEDKKKQASASGGAKKSVPSVGDVIDLEGFGGEVETQDGKKVTLKSLVDESESGVVIFTYPRASTPGCTKQACQFRDDADLVQSGGLTIYGLSSDSPKSNTTFKTKQKLTYDLLCDPSYSLIGAIGMQQGSEKRTKRGVFVINKEGKVLVLFHGGPIPTVDEVKKLVKELEK